MTAATRPNIIPPNVKAIPAELRVLPAWVNWRLEWDEGTGKWTKIPVDSKNGRLASSTDLFTWTTVYYAESVYRRQEYPCDGIGLCRAKDSPYLFVDLDGCLDEDGNLLSYEWAHRTLEVIQGKAYIERSVSGTGLHAIVRATLPEGARQDFKESGKDHTGLAFYTGGRYFTFTGCVWPDSGEIVDLTSEIEQLHGELVELLVKPKAVPKPHSHAYYMQDPPAANSLSDSELIEKARRAKNGPAFSALWDGDIAGYPSHSEADMALCCHLAWWTGKDAARIDALFRQSGLYREDKWDRGNGDYARRTIGAAIASTTDTYDPDRGKNDPPRYDHPGPSAPPTDTAPEEANQSMDLAALLALFKRWLFLPDPLSVLAVLGTSRPTGCPVIRSGCF
jgi:primase-polymerase (primpol)-like protein